MSVGAVVYNAANTGAAIASTNITSGGFERGLLDAVISDPLGTDAGVAIEIHRSHPSASAFTPGRIVRVEDDNGEVTKFEITETDDHLVADAPSETLRVAGRTLLGQWRNWFLRPHGSSDRVAYNFAYPGLDTTAWSTSVSEVDRSSFGFTRPIGWADPYTLGVWSATHSVGSIFGRRQFTLSSATKVVGYASGDDGFGLWIDGERAAEQWAKPTDLEPVYWRPYRAFLLDLAAGTHTLAVEGRNFSGVGTVWASVWPTTGSRLGPGDPIVLTGPSSNTAEPYGVWKWSAYPATRPAPPVTAIVVDQLAKAQADGAASGWSLGFTATVDSDGVAPVAVEWGDSTRTTGFGMLESLYNAGWLTFRVRPGAGLILDAYVTYGTTTGLTLDDDDQADLRKQVAL